MNTSVVLMIIGAAFFNAALGQQTSEIQTPKYYIKVREENINPPLIEIPSQDDADIKVNPKFQIKVRTEKSDVQPSPIEMDLQEPESQGRFRRATCDLLSFDTKWGSLNHSACAAHCLAMRKGYKGGRCRNGICHCRR